MAWHSWGRSQAHLDDLWHYRGPPGTPSHILGGGLQRVWGLPEPAGGISSTSGGALKHLGGCPARSGGPAAHPGMLGRIWRLPCHIWGGSGGTHTHTHRAPSLWGTSGTRPELSPAHRGEALPHLERLLSAHLGRPEAQDPLPGADVLTSGHPGGEAPWPQITQRVPPPRVPRLRRAGIPCPQATIGSTPSCSHPVPEMSQLTEVHPGNYLFYDLQQSQLGSCRPEEVAIRVLTRVIGHYRHRGQLLLDCGWAALSLHGGQRGPEGCAAVEGHPRLRLVGLTQEHGQVEAEDGELDFERFPVGSTLALIPFHACATAAMHPVYFVHAEGRVVELWHPVRGW